MSRVQTSAFVEAAPSRDRLYLQIN